MTTETKAPPTAQSERERMERRIEEDCAEHVATLRDAGRVLDFRRPGTRVYSVRYRIDGPYLIVTGDMGDAIHQWSSQLSWAFLADCTFGYFAEKCRAHPQGRSPKGWDEDVAVAALRRIVTDPEERENYGIPDRTTWARLTGDDPDFWDWDAVDLWSREEWIAWLHEQGHDAFGADFYEWAVGIGQVPDFHQLAHWKMLQLAVAQLPGSGS